MPVRGLLRAGIEVLRSPRADRRRAIEAAAELTRASLELRLLPPTRTIGLLGRAHAASADDPVDAERLREAALVGRTTTLVAHRLPWRPTCLRQALAVQRMLRRRGIPGHLRLGVTNPAEGTAHAWVTVDGRAVVGGRGVERFVPLAAFD